jgi:hypothetical protein
LISQLSGKRLKNNVQRNAMMSQALKSVAAEVLAAAKETPRLFFAPLVGAVRGAYIETVRAYSRR